MQLFSVAFVKNKCSFFRILVEQKLALLIPVIQSAKCSEGEKIVMGEQVLQQGFTKFNSCHTLSIPGIIMLNI